MSPYYVANREGEPSMIAESRKAIVAAFLAFLTPIGTFVAATDEPLDWRAFAAAAIAGLITGGGVWLTANAPRPLPPAE